MYSQTRSLWKGLISIIRKLQSLLWIVWVLFLIHDLFHILWYKVYNLMADIKIKMCELNEQCVKYISCQRGKFQRTSTTINYFSTKRRYWILVLINCLWCEFEWYSSDNQYEIYLLSYIYIPPIEKRSMDISKSCKDGISRLCTRSIPSFWIIFCYQNYCTHVFFM